MSLPHQSLVVWQRADDLFIELHRLTLQRFPAFERYELGSQVRRAAFSIPANIVEGTARESAREKIRFFNVAAASLRELGYALHAGRRLGYINADELTVLERKVRMIGSPLHGLIRRHRAFVVLRATVWLLVIGGAVATPFL
jgi:four helix bundle protein